jgi:hypothetical protein
MPVDPSNPNALAPLTFRHGRFMLNGWGAQLELVPVSEIRRFGFTLTDVRDGIFSGSQIVRMAAA